MDEQVVKLKRGWVKNAAIVFLSVMLVLTFFSNTILNRSLPEVAASYVESGSINTKIRGSGMVSAGESYDVVLEQTRKVEAVYAHVGDYVYTGDVLFLLSNSDSEELKQAQKALDSMRLAYEKTVLSMDDPDYAQENRNIQKAKEALAEAQDELQKCIVTSEEILNAQSALRESEQVQKQLNTALAEADEYLSKVKTEFDALEAKIEALEEQSEALEETIDSYKKQIKGLKNGTGDLEDELAEAQLDLKKAKETYAALRIIYGNDYDELKETAEKIAAGSDVIYQMAALVKDRDAADPQKIAYEKLQPVLNDVEVLESKVAEYEVLVDGQASVQEQIDKLDDACDDAEDQLDDLQDELDDAYDTLSDLDEEIDSAEAQKSYLEEQVDLQADVVSQLEEQYTNLKNKQNEYESAKERVEICQDTLEDLTFALAEQKKADGKIAASQQLDLDNSLKEIQEQEALVAELQLESVGAEVTTNVSGQISSINVTAGRDAVAGDTLAVIEVVDRGYTVKLPVTNEQSQKVRIGDKADVTNYYWGEQLDVTLTSIVNDPSKPGQGKLLVFTINGDISSGQNITLSVGERSANYDSIVPNSALRTDTNGTFVLVLTVKHSPLGNRYIATRVDVNVLAQDDTKAAVSGLSMGDYVITTSSKPLEAGMQVNMVEN